MAMKNSQLADIFCQKKYLKTAIYIKSIDSMAFYDSEKSYFKIMGAHEYHQLVRKFLIENSEKNITMGVIKDVADQIKLTCYKTKDDITSNYIALKGGLLNTETFEYEEPSVDKETFYYVDIDKDESDTIKNNTPLFNKFLSEVIVNERGETDEATVNLVLEMIGYFLLDTVDAHKMFFLVGKGRNGKGVLEYIIENLIGNNFIAHMSIETLTTKQFAMPSLIGKKLNICTEEESKYIRADKLKALTGGDTIDAERKYAVEHISFRPTAKYLFLTNSSPTFDALDDAILDRIIIIPFNRFFAEHERDVKLKYKLIEELPGIFWQIKEAAKRLVQNNFVFSISDLSKKHKKDFEINLSGAMVFCNETYEESEDSYQFIDDMYDAYVAWCIAKGKKKMNYHNFARDIGRLYGSDTISKWDVNSQKTKRARQLRVKVEKQQGGEIEFN